MFADWTDRIAAGEVPPVPPRPEGIERNLVLTLWEWGGPATFAHDELSTDKRNPTANANGPIYGVDWGNDGFPDARSEYAYGDRSAHSRCSTPRRAAGQTASHAAAVAVLGQRALLVRSCHHESCGDGQQRARLDVVAFSPAGESAGFLRAIIRLRSSRRDRRASGRCSTSIRRRKQFHQVDICFDTHHVQFGNDADETLYGNGVFSGALGWVNTRILDETGDEGAAQGWCMPYFD